MLWLSGTTSQAQTGTINLSVHKTVSTQSQSGTLTIGDIVTYTVVVANAPSSASITYATATGVVVTDQLPAGGVSYIPNSASILRGTGAFSSVSSASAITGTWNVGSIAPGDSAVMTMRATITGRGVWFNTAEVTAAGQPDINSTPANQSLLEDDYDAACFSVPIYWYPGDEYTVTIPTGYDQIVWFRSDNGGANTVAISTSTVSTSIAQVNADQSLTIKSPGVYSFTTYRASCPTSNCCNIEVVPGPYGSLGDYVFIDTNKNGVQDDGATGVDGVKVYLYDRTGTVILDSTVTATGGKYLFDSLTDGSYIVRFIAPPGYQPTTPNAPGVADSLDSDAGVNGFTGVYTIDTSQPVSSTARNNTTVDAGFFPNAVLPATLGDYVFVDANKNGIQDAGDTPIPNVTVTLYTNGTATATTTTDITGHYSFTGLTPGSSLSYSVGFTTPTGMTATTPQLGGSDLIDSDVNPATGLTRSVTLAAGEINLNLDAGYYPIPVPPATLGDYVFADNNGNGIQDTGDTAIPGVTVTLYTNGTATATTTTDVTGHYSFTGLTPGSSLSYSVGFTLPTGYTATTPQTGGNDALDSDVNPTTGLTRSVTLAAGETNLNLDAGYIPVYDVGIAKSVISAGPYYPNSQATFQLTVTNNSAFPVYNVRVDDILPAGVSFVSGTGFSTSGANSVSAIAAGPLAANGGTVSMTLTALISPTYSLSNVINIAVVSRYTSTSDITGTPAVDSNPANNTATVTVPLGQQASLGDFVFNDANGNGIQDADEVGIPNVVVTLYLNGSAVATTTTNGSGIYSFTGLTPGSSNSYSVGFTAPAGFTTTTPLSGTDRSKDSDLNPTTGRSASVTLAAGEVNLTIDAGFKPIPATLGDYVFADNNKNGVQDAGDTPIPNVTVTLYTNGTATATTTTDITGHYSFTGLTPGSSLSYSVGFTTPTGMTATTPQVGGNDVFDSDVNPATGLTRSVTLAAGETNLNLDAGFSPLPTPTATLGDFVFSDTNGNGIQDTGEIGIPNVTVTLYLNGSAVATTTTNAGGLYSFTGLTPGSSNSYSVGFTAPTGFTATTPLSGTDRTKDSDVDPTTGRTGSVTLAAGEVNLTIDAGYTPTCPGNLSVVASNDLGICNGEVATLVATASTPTAQIRWYLTPYDGVAFATTTSGASLTVNPTTTTVYYAEAFTTAGCVSPRKPVVITVSTVPTPICLGNIKNTCPATTVNLTTIQIENQSTGLVYEWYTSLTRSAATRVTNLTAVGAGTYYLFARSGNCYSNPTVLTVEIVDCNCQSVAGVSVGSSLTACEGTAVPLTATLSGAATSVRWTSNGTGTFSNATALMTSYTPSAADVALGLIQITATTNDPDGTGVCQPASSSLMLKINKRPDAPLGVACDDTLVCQGSSTKLVGFAPGGKINWYNEANVLIGSTVSGGKLTVTPSRAGAVVYYAETVSPEGCVSATRSSLTITVGTCLADLAVLKVVTPGPYSVGQKITYAITATNKGPITATTVKVSDVLPASLAFVSATPAGQYNAATGIWTIGTMTSGSSRNLLIEATIKAAGSIKNTAIISSPENDPAHAQDDTSSVTIDVNQCVTQPPVIACAITELCKGGSTVLTATGCTSGTVVWSNGQTGASINVSPNVTTTYTASCVTGNACTSAASNPITVTVLDPQIPTITASATAVCPGTSVTLTASGCTGGTIEWSEPGKTGNVIVVNPLGKTTYTAQCRINGCLSSPAVKTIDSAGDLPTPTITCSETAVCPGETVTLTVQNCTGIPVWSSTTATTGSIVVTPTPGNNSYTVYCKNGACVSPTSAVYTINLISLTPPTIVASADTVCARGPVSLTAIGCTGGTVVWNVAGKVGSVITVNPDANISYYAQCKYRTCLSDPSNSVKITVLTPAAPIIAATKTLICSGEKVTLTATGCAGGTVKWYPANVVGASVDIYPTVTGEYYATCKQGSCESAASNKIRITVNTGTAPAPTVTASSTAVCNGGLVSLTATGCTGGTIQWSDGQTGPVVSVTATPTRNEFYAICTTPTGCGSGKSNVVRVSVTPTPTPTVICSSGTICAGESLVLTVQNCQGTPHWIGATSTATSLTVNPMVTTSYSVYCQDGVCKSDTSVQYTITVVPVTAPTITASSTVVTPGGSVTLTATGCPGGEVIWSANDVNGNNKGTSIVVVPVGTQTYYAQCKFRTCLSDPSNTIVINPGNCIAKAGTLVPTSPTICPDSSGRLTITATLGGGRVVPDGYSVLYILTKGAERLVQMTSTAPSFTLASGSGTYTIHTLVYNATPSDPNYLDLTAVQPGVTRASDLTTLIASRNVCADLDATGAATTVGSITPPVLSAQSPITVCTGNTVSLTATGCVGGTVTWSDGTTGPVIQKVVTSSQWLAATCTLNGCTSAPSRVYVNVAVPAIPIIVSSNATVCRGESVTLTAAGCEGGTYLWSNGTTGSTLVITPTADVSYQVKCKIGTCEGDWSASTTIQVGTPPTPTISIAGSNTVCFAAPVTLTAQGCPANSYVTWSNGLVGNSITISLSGSTTLTAQCCVSTTCKSAPSNAIAITVLPKVTAPATRDRVNACPFNTVDLATGVTSQPSTAGGIFEYYTSESLSAASKVANPAAVGTGTYYVVEKTTAGCYSLPSVIHVNITTCGEPTPCDATNPATANAGADASICAAKTYQLHGTMGGAGTTAHWVTSGTGTFDSSFSLNAVYTASAADLLAGNVTLTLSVSTNNAACPVATDAMVLTINGIKGVPKIDKGSTNLCYGDSVTLSVVADANIPANVSYLWTNSAGQTVGTTRSIVVKTSGVYSVQLLDPNGCSSVKSDPVTINVAAPVAPPLVTNLRNTCPSKIVDLTKALSTTTAGSTYTYRICECVTSNIVIRPDSVCEGTYWIVERTAQGCVSAPAKVVVKVFNCATDTIQTDVNISKTASPTVVRNGAPVTYTVKVDNLGSHTAKNIDVRDVLPQGLELVSTPANYTVSNGVITKRIDSIAAGQSYTMTYSARITKKGVPVVNTAQITYLDQVDPNLANNTSSVSVIDSTAQRSSLIGLAKSVLGTPTAVGDSLIRVSYNFVVTNYGDDTLRHVSVVDDLAYAFRPNTVTSTTLTMSGNNVGMVPNLAFSGSGSSANMFDSTSYLAPGKSQIVKLDILVKRAVGDTTKAFDNIATATAFNSVTTVTDISANGGDADPDNDGNPTNNSGVSSFTLGAPQAGGPSIGVALAVVKVEIQPDSSYNVTYKATIKNFGDVALTGISLTDSLIRTFTAPVSYSVVGAPIVGAGSTLVANTGFDGNAQSNILTNASTLAAGVQDTVLIMVNLKLNGNNGPFYSSVTAEGHTADSTQTVRDISNNGLDPKPEGATSTTVRFDLPKGLIGVSKSVGTPTLVSDGIYDIPYTITVSNMGTVPLTKVQVADNLSETFGRGALIVSNRIPVAAGPGLKVDTLYSGQGLVTNMLVDSASSLAVGASSSLSFTVRVDVKNADTLAFNNTARATAVTPDSVTVEDVSTAGTNNDPDNDLDPRNNNQPTPVSLNGISSDSYIGLAMSVRDTVRKADGSYNVTYQIVVKNYGSSSLSAVSVTDSLSNVFNTQTGSSFTIAKAPITTSTGSTLKLNPDFNGVSDPRLVFGDSTSTLAAGKVDTILVVVNVFTNGSTTTFLNTAYAEAKAPSGTVRDVSTNGLNPDLNGNGNPTDSNERESTPLNLPPTSSSVFIPQGFSPNGDGINDLFVIRGLEGVTVSLEVYNRWGHLVYKNDDYHNDWDGKPNTGISISSDANGLPDGTYYYVITTSDSRKFVRYMTINR
jgi:uncharacterized repeat protein (TIGR01451 family)/gliding motility-associated-like protein